MDDIHGGEFNEGESLHFNGNGSEGITIPFLPNIIEQLQRNCIVKYKDRGVYSVKDWRIRGARMKGKKLYVLKDVVQNSKEFKEDAKNIYPYEIDFVDLKTIEKAIYNLDSTVCYIALNETQVFDALTGDVLFISSVYPDNQMLLELNFFKDLARKIKKD